MNQKIKLANDPEYRTDLKDMKVWLKDMEDSTKKFRIHQ